MRTRHPRQRRQGFTLVELIIVIVLLGLVGSAITTVVVRQQRFYRSANEIIDTRGQVRQAAGILPIELRGISSIGGDLHAIADRQVEFLAPTGSSIVCTFTGGAPNASITISLPPATLSSGQVYTAFLSTPVAGDTVFVFSDGDNDNSLDDVWVKAVITTLWPVSTTYCPSTAGFAATTDAAQPRNRYTLTAVNPTVWPTVKTGAPIRFTRPVRYSIYQASDTKWYLGYETYTAGSWSGVQPVSGPYLAGDAANDGDRGLRFRYYNQAGTEITAVAGATGITRVDIAVRSATQQAVQLSGTAPTQVYRDSLNLSVAIRNWQ